MIAGFVSARWLFAFIFQDGVQGARIVSSVPMFCRRVYALASLVDVHSGPLGHSAVFVVIFGRPAVISSPIMISIFVFCVVAARAAACPASITTGIAAYGQSLCGMK